MAIVNQRVCDLPSCAQPITPKSKVTYVLPSDDAGEPDLKRQAEFNTAKCARSFLRGISRTENNERLEKLIAVTTDKEKLVKLKAKLNTDPPTVYPTAPADG